MLREGVETLDELRLGLLISLLNVLSRRVLDVVLVLTELSLRLALRVVLLTPLERLIGEEDTAVERRLDDTRLPE